jgi:AraC-like DNA-binding protein
MRHITEEAIAWIAAQRERGASLSRIATAVGVSRSEVSRISTQERAKQKAPRAR